MNEKKINKAQGSAEPSPTERPNMGGMGDMRDMESIVTGQIRMDGSISNTAPTESYGNTNSNEKIREIHIIELNRGFTVQVGCHTFAISKAEELIQLLSEYIAHPSETESKWFNNQLMTR